MMTLTRGVVIMASPLQKVPGDICSPTSSPAQAGPRITVVAPGFSRDERDSCIPALRTLVRELAGRTTVRVLTLHFPFRAETYDLGGARVRALGGANVRGLARAALLVRAVARLVADQRRHPAAVLHGFWADEAGAVAVAAARVLRIPAVVSLAGGELVALPEIGYGGWLSRSGRALTPRALRQAARVGVGSAALERLAAPFVESNRLVRLPLGVDTTLFHPDGAKDAQPLHDRGAQVLAVGSLTAVKDHATILRALPAVAARIPDVHLHIVGDGPLRGQLTAQAEAIGVAQRVTFHGARPHHELPARYRAANLVVVSSRFESQGMAALEAAACGTAVVGTAVGIVPELPGVVGVPPGDDAALADAVVSALGDRPRLAARAAAALDLVRHQYDVTRVVDRLCALYRDVIDD